jgi:hypothetical protein
MANSPSIDTDYMRHLTQMIRFHIAGMRNHALNDVRGTALISVVTNSIERHGERARRARRANTRRQAAKEASTWAVCGSCYRSSLVNIYAMLDGPRHSPP